MKNLSTVIAVAGILLAVYSVIGRFVGDPAIGLGIIPIKAKAGLILANSLMLVSVIMKQREK